MQAWFNIQKSINVIHHIILWKVLWPYHKRYTDHKRYREIIWQNVTSLMIETLSKPAIEGSCLKASIKANNNLATNIILNDEMWLEALWLGA